MLKFSVGATEALFVENVDRIRVFIADDPAPGSRKKT
jgi:hypothetical protein